MDEDLASHWNESYDRKGVAGVSWTEDSPAASLALIEEAALDEEAAIVDVGGGASHLASELLDRGYSDLTVADISAAALRAARDQLGAEAAHINWLEADVRTHDFGRAFDLWHDRAVFHFMVEEADRTVYLANLRRSLKVGGHLVLAAFGPRGPTSCSGLPVRRYGAGEMAQLLGPDFELVAQELVEHRTPSGSEQQFQYALFERVS